MKMPDIPRLIFWELTKKCNLACVHCRAESEQIDYSGELDTRQIESVIDDISGRYKPIMVLTGGEPLYRDDIFTISRYCAERGLRVALATNGTLVDAGMARMIRGSGIIRVSISVDGSDALVHDGMRGIPGAFDRVMKGIDELRSAGVEFQINTTVTKRNEHQLDDILDLAVKIGAKALHLFLLVPVGCGIQIADTDMISPARYEEILNWFYDRSRTSEIEFKATCAPHYYRVIRQRARQEGRKLSFENDGMAAMTRGCLAGSGVCFISHRGDVQPCGYLPVIAGNVLTTPFPEIWDKSDLFKTLRDADALKGRCGACEYRVVCGGCRARAYYETGDYLDEEPFCIHQPARTPV